LSDAAGTESAAARCPAGTITALDSRRFLVDEQGSGAELRRFPLAGVEQKQVPEDEIVEGFC
jgi:hypothetical protein